jgi:biopolymer transport protein ExbD
MFSISDTSHINLALTDISLDDSVKGQQTSPVDSLVAQVAPLGWILLNKKLISPTQLESALATQALCQRKLGEVLVEQQLISNKQLEQALKEQYWRRNGYWVI